MRESLDGRDQAGDARRRFLNLRRDPANRTSGCRPAQDRRRAWVRSTRHRDAIESVERHRGFGKRLGNRGVDAVVVEPVGDRVLAFGLLDRRQHAVRAWCEARRPQRIDGGELIVGQRGGGQRARGLLGILEPILEQRGAAFDRGDRIVQLVGQSGRELSERHHLLVLQAARREPAAAIEHLVHQDRREFLAVANHLRQMAARDRKNFRELLSDRVAGWADQARIGKHAGYVTGPPLHDLVPAGAAIEIDGDVAAQHDEQIVDWNALGAQNLALAQLTEGAVRGQPRQLVARSGPHGLVSGETFDEIQCGQLVGPRESCINGAAISAVARSIMAHSSMRCHTRAPVRSGHARGTRRMSGHVCFEHLRRGEPAREGRAGRSVETGTLNCFARQRARKS